MAKDTQKQNSNVEKPIATYLTKGYIPYIQAPSPDKKRDNQLIRNTSKEY